MGMRRRGTPSSNLGMSDSLRMSMRLEAFSAMGNRRRAAIRSVPSPREGVMGLLIFNTDTTATWVEQRTDARRAEEV